MKLDPPRGVPARVKHAGKTFYYDRLGGTGEPIYLRTEGKDDEVRRHVILVRSQ